MSAALFEQSQVMGSVNITGANAGNYTGTGSVVVATGTTAPGAYVKEIVIASRGSNVANRFRFYSNLSTVKTFLFEIAIPQNDAGGYVRGFQNPSFSQISPVNILLPSPSYTLEVNMEVAGNYDISARGKSLT